MVDYVADIARQLGPWAYLIVYLVVMLECQPLLGLFMPGETLVVASGFLAREGVFDLKVLIAVVAAAAVIGDTIGYELGRRLGRGWLQHYGHWFGVREKHLAKVDAFFLRHGGKSVFFSHFLHLLRALMPFMAGAGRVPYLRFAFYNTLGCVLWATIFVVLGYFFGQSWELLHRWAGRAGAVLGAFVFFFSRSAGFGDGSPATKWNCDGDGDVFATTTRRQPEHARDAADRSSLQATNAGGLPRVAPGRGRIRNHFCFVVLRCDRFECGGPPPLARRRSQNLFLVPRARHPAAYQFRRESQPIRIANRSRHRFICDRPVSALATFVASLALVDSCRGRRRSALCSPKNFPLDAAASGKSVSQSAERHLPELARDGIDSFLRATRRLRRGQSQRAPLARAYVPYCQCRCLAHRADANLSRSSLRYGRDRGDSRRACVAGLVSDRRRTHAAKPSGIQFRSTASADFHRTAFV